MSHCCPVKVSHKRKFSIDHNKLQVFSVTLFEKIPLNKGFFETNYTSEDDMLSNQSNLFDY